VGDSIAVLHHWLSDPDNPPNGEDRVGYKAWYLGYVDEVRADIVAGTVTYLLVGYSRHLSDIYPGGNDENDVPVVYKLTITQEFEVDPNDPTHLDSHYSIDKTKVSDIVQDLYDKYLVGLGIWEEGVEPDIDVTPDETDLWYLKLEGERNLMDILDMLARMAGGWTWGIDVEEKWKTGVNEAISYVYPRLFFKAPTTTRWAAVQVGQHVKAMREETSKRHLYNVVRILGAHVWNAMPYVTRFQDTFYKAGSIAKYGRKRITLLAPELRDDATVLKFLDWFWSEYAAPRKFYTITQLGGEKRLVPWRRLHPFGVGETEYRGGILEVKDENGAIMGEYHHIEAHCIFNDYADWRIEIGPKDPTLRAGSESEAALFGRLGPIRKPPDPQTYLPALVGYAIIVSRYYSPARKDYFYTIQPVQDEEGNPVENASLIQDVYNVMSFQGLPGTDGRCAKALLPGSLVAYYRGWDLRKKQPYYYVSEEVLKLIAFPVLIDKGTCATWTHEVEIPEESAFYKTLVELHVAPTTKAFAGGTDDPYWNISVRWDFGPENPKMILTGKSVGGAARSTNYYANVWCFGHIPKRGDI